MSKGARVVTTVSFDPDVLKSTRLRAIHEDTNVSALVDVALRALLNAQPPERVGEVERMTKRERGVYAAYDALLEKARDSEDVGLRGNVWFNLRDFTRQTGMYPSEALQGLRGLENRGVFRCIPAQDLLESRRNPDVAHVDHWSMK